MSSIRGANKINKLLVLTFFLRLLSVPFLTTFFHHYSLLNFSSLCNHQLLLIFIFIIEGAEMHFLKFSTIDGRFKKKN